MANPRRAKSLLELAEEDVCRSEVAARWSRRDLPAIGTYFVDLDQRKGFFPSRKRRKSSIVGPIFGSPLLHKRRVASTVSSGQFQMPTGDGVLLLSTQNNLSICAHCHPRRGRGPCRGLHDGAQTA